MFVKKQTTKNKKQKKNNKKQKTVGFDPNNITVYSTNTSTTNPSRIF